MSIHAHTHTIISIRNLTGIRFQFLSDRMDQLTEKLLQSLHAQSNGYVNEECCSSGPSSMNLDPLTAPSSPEPNFVLGPHQQRRRLLSCIAENGPENDVYSSLPMDDHEAYDIDCYNSNRSVILGDIKSFACETEDAADFITTLDESCILDIESLEDVSEIPNTNENSVLFAAANVRRPFSSASFIESIEPNDRSLTKSCYGKLENVNVTDDDGQADSINGICEDFIFLNPAFNRGKCRTPLPVISLHSSFYDEHVSITDSISEQNTVQLHKSHRVDTSDSTIEMANCSNDAVNNVKWHDTNLGPTNDQPQPNAEDNGGKLTIKWINFYPISF